MLAGIGLLTGKAFSSKYGVISVVIKEPALSFAAFKSFWVLPSIFCCSSLSINLGTLLVAAPKSFLTPSPAINADPATAPPCAKTLIVPLVSSVTRFITASVNCCPTPNGKPLKA